MIESTPKQKKLILLTGATGSFGRFLAEEILRSSDARLILLVRGETQEVAEERVKDIVEAGHGRVQVLKSDLAIKNLGLSEQDYTSIIAETTLVIHSAASVKFNRPLDEARRYNIEPTSNVLRLAEQCAHLERIGFVGTALVAGNRSGLILEDEFEHSSGFKNTYEQSKYEAEMLVRSYFDRLPIVIFRPPLILSSPSRNTKSFASHVNALSLGASFVGRGILGFLPGTPESALDVVESNTVAQSIISLALKPDLRYRVYHITNGSYAPRISDIHAIIEKKVGHPVNIEFCGSEAAYQERVRKIPWYDFTMRHAHRKISSFITELAYPKIYDNSHTLEELGLPTLQKNPLAVIESSLSNS